MRLVTSFLAFAALASAAFGAPKYVFVFIGDGMSTPQRLMAEDYSRRTGRGELAMNHLSRKTETVTKSANKVVTDSAAAATAIACGEKTDNGMLGVRPDGSRIESVAEIAKKAGLKVGIVTTVTIVHATPAGFYAHNRNRGDSRHIAMELVRSGFDYFAGGGIGGWKQPSGGYFDTNGNFVKLAEGAAAEPGVDPYTLWRKKGFAFVKDDLAAFKALKPGRPAWCVFGEGGMEYVLDSGSAGQPGLADLVEKGIELLDGPQGFFMMCEGGKVDYVGHANDAAGSVAEQLALDDAVKVALRFRERHPGETLVITTGDHETGGLIRGVTGAGATFDPALLANQRCTASKFGKLLKDAKNKGGEWSFEIAMDMAKTWFGLGGAVTLTEGDREALKAAFDKNTDEFAGAVKRTLAAHAGLTWKSGGHTALPTMTTAEGPGSEILEGMADNSEIGSRLKGLLAK